MIHRRTPNCVALLTLSGALSVGCRPQPGASSDGRPLTVVVSGDTAGWIVPCGCTSNQSGGLPRRATYLAELAARVRSARRRRGRRAGRQIDLRPPQVRGHPSRRAGHGRCGPQHRRGRSGPRPRLPPRGRPAAARSFRLHECPAQRRAAAGRAAADRARRPAAAWRSSACSVRSLPPMPGLRITSPREAILQALQQAAGRYQAAIVLAYVPEEELQPLAEGLPEVDVVVGGPTGQPVAPRHLGPTLVLSATKQGKFLARLDAPPDAKQHWTGGIVELSDRFADDQAQVANVAEFRQELGRRDIAAADTSFGPRLPPGAPKEFAVAGTKTCRDCHKPETQVWDKSRHARAWKSLARARGPGRSRLPAVSHHGLRPARRVRLDRPQPGAGRGGLRKLSWPQPGACPRARRSTRAISPRPESMYRLPRSREQPAVRLRRLLGQDPARQGP